MPKFALLGPIGAGVIARVPDARVTCMFQRPWLISRPPLKLLPGLVEATVVTPVLVNCPVPVIVAPNTTVPLEKLASSVPPPLSMKKPRLLLGIQVELEVARTAPPLSVTASAVDAPGTSPKFRSTTIANVPLLTTVFEYEFVPLIV